MAFRQVQPVGPGQAAQHRNSGHGLFAGAAQDFPVPPAADPIEDDAGNGHIGAEFGEALEHRGRRGGLGARVDNQHHRPAGQARKCRRGTVIAAVAGLVRFHEGPVEQPHDPFADDHIRV